MSISKINFLVTVFLCLHFRLSVSLSLCLCICLSTHIKFLHTLSVRIRVLLPKHSSYVASGKRLSVCPSVVLSVCLSVCLSVDFKFVHTFSVSELESCCLNIAAMQIRVSVRLSVCLCVCLYVWLFICLSVCVFVCLFTCLSVCRSQICTHIECQNQSATA